LEAEGGHMEVLVSRFWIVSGEVDPVADVKVN
jgi:hypothetical protein